MRKQTPSSDHFIGAGWMILSGLCFVSVGIIVRYMGSDLPAVQASFIRYIWGLLLLIPAMMQMQWPTALTRNFSLHLVRGLAHGMAVMLWFYAIARVPLAEVTAIGYTTPFYVALGAVVFFGERMQFRRISAIILGFVGTMVILRPGFREIELGLLAQLLAAPCFAISFLFAKKLTQTENSRDITVMLAVFCALALMPGAIMEWQTPTVAEMLWLLLVAVFATLGHYTLTRAFASAPMTATQPFSFLQLVWAILFGYLLFGEQPDLGVLVGSAIIVGSVSYLVHREAIAAKRV